MRIPTFLEMDSDWKTYTITWWLGFNDRLGQRVPSNPAPPIGFATLYADHYRQANAKALSLLDDRQINPLGKLPKHVCGEAFQVWYAAEQRLKKDALEHPATFKNADDTALLDNVYSALLAVFKFNLATLTLIDETSSEMMRSMAEDHLNETLSILDLISAHEPKIEQILGGEPSPTRQVREVVIEFMSRPPARSF